MHVAITHNRERNLETFKRVKSEVPIARIPDRLHSFQACPVTWPAVVVVVEYTECQAVTVRLPVHRQHGTVILALSQFGVRMTKLVVV